MRVQSMNTHNIHAYTLTHANITCTINDEELCHTGNLNRKFFNNLFQTLH